METTESSKGTVIYEGWSGDRQLAGANQFIKDAKFVAMVPRNDECRKEYIAYRLEDDGVTITEDEANAECHELLKQLIKVASNKIPPMDTATRLKAKFLKKEFFRELRIILGEDANTFLGDLRIKTT